MNNLEQLKKTFDDIGQKYELHHYQMNSTVSGIHFDAIIKIDNGLGTEKLICMFYFLAGKLVGHACWD